jgi:hypothetical protein
LNPFPRRKPVDVPAETRTEGIDADGYPPRKIAGAHAGRHTMKPVDMNAHPEMRPATRPDMNPGANIGRIGKGGRRKRRCEQKAAKQIACVMH